MKLKKKLLSILLILGLVISCSGVSDDTGVDSDYEPDTTVVYITETGDKYHRGSCQYLHSSKIQTTVSEAKANGYTACSVCDPPKYITDVEQ